MKSKHNKLATLTCASLLGSAALSQAATVAWNFDSPSLDGWVSVTGSKYGLSTAEGAHSGSYFIGDTVNTDQNPDTTQVMSSATFQFDLTSGLSAYLRKGHADTGLVQSAGVVGSDPTEDGFRGIALFDVVANSYLLTAGKPTSSNDWDQVGWSLSTLTGAGVTTSRTYQLHLIDQAEGGWGHIQLDTVSFNGEVVPEPSAAVLGGLGLLALLRRRRA